MQKQKETETDIVRYVTYDFFRFLTAISCNFYKNDKIIPCNNFGN